jgi:hypothetical protein
MEAKKRAARRQSISCPFEASAYAAWYQQQPQDPARVWKDPIAAFRAQQRQR